MKGARGYPHGKDQKVERRKRAEARAKARCRCGALLAAHNAEAPHSHENGCPEFRPLKAT